MFLHFLLVDMFYEPFQNFCCGINLFSIILNNILSGLIFKLRPNIIFVVSDKDHHIRGDCRQTTCNDVIAGL